MLVQPVHPVAGIGVTRFRPRQPRPVRLLEIARPVRSLRLGHDITDVPSIAERERQQDDQEREPNNAFHSARKQICR